MDVRTLSPFTWISKRISMRMSVSNYPCYGQFKQGWLNRYGTGTTNLSQGAGFLCKVAILKNTKVQVKQSRYDGNKQFQFQNNDYITRRLI